MALAPIPGFGNQGFAESSDALAFFLAFDTAFSQAYQTTQVWRGKLANDRPSVTDSELYGWMDRIAAMQPWVGARVEHGVQSETLRVKNRPFELTVNINKWHLADDQHGLYSMLPQQIGQQAAKWADYQIAAAIQDNILGTDGLSFFNSAHPIDLYAPSKGTYTNDYTSFALNPTNLAQVVANMRSRRAQDGTPLMVEPDTLIVPPALQYQAMNILNAAFIAPQTIGTVTQVGTNENVLKGMLNLIVLPELAAGMSFPTFDQATGEKIVSAGGSDTKWYVAALGHAVKPVTWQMRQAPIVVNRTDPRDPAVFDRASYVYGIEGRGAPVLTFPFLMSRCAA